MYRAGGFCKIYRAGSLRALNVESVYFSQEARTVTIKRQVVESSASVERLQTRAAARIPHLDGPVVRRQRQPGRVVREGHQANPITMALERLQTRTPLIAQS